MVGGMLGHIKMASHTTRPIKRRRLSVWTVYVPGADEARAAAPTPLQYDLNISRSFAEPCYFCDPSSSDALFARAICIIQNHNRIRGELRFEDMQCRGPCHLTERARRPVDNQQINLINIPKGVRFI
jgi:hypothetical protein